ncbi:acetyltransferase [Veronia pacifica]|uniref:Acetyltransferase n=2 Tax=Veronia pacifica TaxID=1080227 RepID=A0A1C3EIH8_9GAMM|nr:acetyltransferase [Veronia pacifica]
MEIYKARLGNNTDFEFLYQVKVAAEYDAINQVFGWDEELQRTIHLDDWEQGKPNIISIDGQKVGSYLLLDKGEYFYFCRFFLLPEFQGRGIGSKILSECLTLAGLKNKPVRLCFLQGNKVERLYRKFGFNVYGEDKQFVYMEWNGQGSHNNS